MTEEHDVALMRARAAVDTETDPRRRATAAELLALIPALLAVAKQLPALVAVIRSLIQAFQEAIPGPPPGGGGPNPPVSADDPFFKS